LEVAKALEEVGQIRDDLTEKVSEIKKALFIKVGEDEVPISKALEVVFKSRAQVPDLSQLVQTSEGGGDGTPGGDKRIPWDEMSQKLDKGIAAKKITLGDRAQAENAWKTGELHIVTPILDKCE